MEWLHLTGPPPAIHRLESLAADLGVAHDVTDGVLRVPLDAVDRLVDGAGSVLAPLEAGLVLAVRADVDAGTPLALLALAAMAPTLAQLVARKAHRVLLAAIESREAVSVGFQPVVDLRTGLTAGFEALLRVRIGRHDVSPAEVLAVADEAGRLREVDAIARSIAVTEAATAIGDRILFLNVLPASLPVPFEDLAPFAAEVIERGLDPTRIVLESPVGPAGALRRHLRAVFEAGRAAGFLVGLDNVRSERDLAAISFRPDVVKLDRSLVRGLPSPSGTRAFGSLVRECAQSASTLVAQGIETPEQLRAVRDLGVRFAQGWALGRPGAITAEAAAIA